MIRSTGWYKFATTASTGAVGSQSIIFNQQFASIKSALILPSNVINAVNKSFDFIDITNAGTYNCKSEVWNFYNSNFIQTKRSAILQELRKSQEIYIIQKIGCPLIQFNLVDLMLQ